MKKSIIILIIFTTIISLYIFKYEDIVLSYSKDIKIEYKNISIKRNANLVLDTVYEDDNFYYRGVVPILFTKMLLVLYGEKTLKETEIFNDWINILKKDGYKKFYKFYDNDKNMIKISFIDSEKTNKEFKELISYLNNQNLKDGEFICNKYDQCRSIFVYNDMDILSITPEIEDSVTSKIKKIRFFKIYINNMIVSIEFEVRYDSKEYKSFMYIAYDILNQLYKIKNTPPATTLKTT